MPWIKNFGVDRAGYHLALPVMLHGIPHCQKVLFGNADVMTESYSFLEGIHFNASYFRKDELLNLIECIIQEILQNPEKIEQLHQRTYQLNDQFFTIAKKVLTQDLKQLTTQQLGLLFQELIHIQRDSHTEALSTTWFVDSEGSSLTKLLMDMTKEYTKKSKSKIDPAHAFSILTQLPQNSLTMKEEIESLSIAQQIQKNPAAKNILLNLKDLSHIPEDFPKELKEKMLQHYEAYRWLAFIYMGPAYDLDFYMTMWKSLIREKDLDKKIAQLNARPQKVKKERDTIIKSLNITKKDLRTYNIAADIVFLKGYRKEAIFHGSYALSYLLKEIAKRHGLSYNQVYLLTYDEIIKTLGEESNFHLPTINARLGFHLWHIKGNVFEIITGTDAKQTAEKLDIIKEEIDLSLTELTGVCACSGYGEGQVKIINHLEDMAKMQQGDVMVSHTTWPSLVPAMKKASAIITEDGGITCHAAIVSRELNTPCITAVKVATKILKDGDTVKVNASEGTITIIR